MGSGDLSPAGPGQSPGLSRRVNYYAGRNEMRTFLQPLSGDKKSRRGPRIRHHDADRPGLHAGHYRVRPPDLDNRGAATKRRRGLPLHGSTGRFLRHRRQDQHSVHDPLYPGNCRHLGHYGAPRANHAEFQCVLRQHHRILDGHNHLPVLNPGSLPLHRPRRGLHPERRSIVSKPAAGSTNPRSN